MGTIRKYDNELKQWVTVGGSDAQDISITDVSILENIEKNNVESVLKQHKNDIETLKSNVAWLAKYGGGGSGTGGGGTNALNVVITVDGKPNTDTNNVVTLMDGKQIPITVNADGNNLTLKFDITVLTSDQSTTIKTFKNVLVNKDVVYLTKDDFNSVNITKTQSIIIRANNNATLTTKTWYGIVQIPSIKITAENPIETNIINWPNININTYYTIGITGTYAFYVSINGSEYLPYGENVNLTKLQDTYIINLSDIHDLPSDKHGVGTNHIKIKMVDVNNTELYGETSVNQTLLADDPLILSIDKNGNSILSKDSNNPTICKIFSNSYTILAPFIVYYGSKFFFYKIGYHVGWDNFNENNVQWSELSKNSYSYNELQENASILVSDINLENCDKYIISIYIKDGSTEKVTIENFYIKFSESENSFLEQNQIDSCIADFFAFDSGPINNQGEWNGKYNNYKAIIKNINAQSRNINNETSSLRLQNSSYLEIPNLGLSKQADNVPIKFTLNIFYKCDYHPDDERCILQWGSPIIELYLYNTFINYNGGDNNTNDIIINELINNGIIDSINNVAIKQYDNINKYGEISVQTRNTSIKNSVYKVINDLIDNNQINIDLINDKYQFSVIEEVKTLSCTPNKGIIIRAHDLYIGSQKITTLPENEDINVTITFDEEGKSGRGNLFVYIDGTIEYCSLIDLNTLFPDNYIVYNNEGGTNMYIGTCVGDEGEYYNTDMNIYRLIIYEKCLTPYDILVDYLNTKTVINNNGLEPNFNIINEGLKRNFFDTEKNSYLYSFDKEDTYSNNEDDIAFNHFNLSKLINGDEISDQLDNFTCPIPIVYIDVSNNTNWTWSNFVKPMSSSGVLKTTSANLQYYDGTKKYDKISIGVEPQGTSTLGDFTKNLKILFEYENTNTVFSPKKEWLPEKSYTLKADIVDSSHSLNTSIGQFANTEFALNENYDNTYYPFSTTVAERFREFKETEIAKKYFPDVTLKHGVEGFPVFAIMRFAPENGKEQIRTLGIYQFILGRDSQRNLGYEFIKGIKDKNGNDFKGSLSFPLISNEITFETEKIDGYWLEFTENNSFSNNIDFQNLTADTFSNNKNLNGAFWQKSANFYNTKMDVKYAYPSLTSNNVSEIEPFQTFIDTIIQLPVCLKRFSSYASGITRNEMLGITYPKLELDGNKWIDTGYKNEIKTNNDDILDLLKNINIDCISKYFVFIMLFGLLDNAQKNMPIKFFKKFALDENGNKLKDANGNYVWGEWETALLGIYDTDSGLGQDNQSKVNVDESMWLCGINNDNNNNFTETSPKNGKNKTIVATSNKLWTIDTNKLILNLGLGKDSQGSGSIYTVAWVALKDVLIKNMNKYYNRTDCTINDLADYYYNKYFLPQTEGCGELLFNLNYISKYINKYETNDGFQNQIEKLHGRRKYQIKSWLKNRIIFLDSFFLGLGDPKTGDSESLTTINVGKITSSLYPEVKVTTNTPVLMQYNNQGSNSGYVFCNKNEEQGVNFGANIGDTIDQDFSKIHFLSNPNSIIKIGSSMSEYPLNEIGFSSFNTSFPYLTEYNVSAKVKGENKGLSMMSNDYMDKFCRTLPNGNKLSELRTIDFRKTAPALNETTYILNIEKGFDKLQNLYINDSCITSVIFPKNISLKDFDVSNSNIKDLVINEQNFIETIDVKNCFYLGNLNVSNCSSIKDIKIDSSNENLETITISSCESLKYFECTKNKKVKNIEIGTCYGLEKIKINDCKNLSVLSISLEGLKELDVSGCEKLERIIFTGTNSNKLKVLNVSNTSLKYIGNGESNIVDLYDCKGLLENDSIINFEGNKYVEYIQLPNEKDTPVQLKKSFYGCTSLKRIYGHFEIRYVSSSSNMAGMFRNCSNFSLHGANDINAMWKSVNIYDVNHLAVDDEHYNNIEYYSPKTPREIINDQNNEKDKGDYFSEGTNVTNISLYNSSNALDYAFRGTDITTFDVYYIFNILSKSNLNRISILYTFYNTIHPLFSWEKGNNPKRELFQGCECIYRLHDVFSSEKVYLLSPENEKNNGIFSPLINLEQIYNLFSGGFISSKKIWKRYDEENYNKLNYLGHVNNIGVVDDDSIDNDYFQKWENYQTKYMNHLDETGNLDEYFSCIPNIETIYYSFRMPSLDYDSLKYNVSSEDKNFNIYKCGIPYTCKRILYSFITTYTTGTFKIPNLFNLIGSTNNKTKINSISSSFIMNTPNTEVPIGKYKTKPRLEIDNDSLSLFPYLVYFGYDDEDENAGDISMLSFNGYVDKYIVGETFPYNVLNECPSIEVFAGFFKNAKTDNAYQDVVLPYEMFKKTSELRDISCLFENMDKSIEFTLSSMGFSNCRNMKKLYRLFYYEPSQNNYGGARGMIPYKFFYHGDKQGTNTLYICNWEPEYEYYPLISKSNVQVEEFDENTYLNENYINKIIEVIKGDEEYPSGYYKISFDEENNVYVANIVTHEDTLETAPNNINSDRLYYKTSNKYGFKLERKEDGKLYETKEIYNDVFPIYQITNYYSIPNSNIVNIQECFYGNTLLSAYKDNIDLLEIGENGEKNPDYIPQEEKYINCNYILSKNGVWNELDASNVENKYMYKYIGYWGYNGDPSSISEEEKNNCLFKETFNIEEITTSSIINKNNVINYMCPPDLLRYVKNENTTNITGLFHYCGMDFSNSANGIMGTDDNYFTRGINGRIPPYLLMPINNVTNISYMFTFCRNISSYMENSNIYIIPNEFFSYAQRINTLCKTFAGITIEKGTNLNVFTPLGNNSIDVRGLFSTCLYGNDNEGNCIVENIFTNVKLSKMSALFSRYDYTISNDVNNKSGVIIRSTSGSFIVPKQQVIFNDNFNSTKLPKTDTINYVYYDYSYGSEVNDSILYNLPNISDNNFGKSV